MMMSTNMSVRPLLVLLGLLAANNGARAASSSSVEASYESPYHGYSFEQYRQDFGKDNEYSSSTINDDYSLSNEYMQRQEVFESNLKQIVEHNNRHSSYTLSVNEFTDRMGSHELPLGYDKHLAAYMRSSLPTTTTTSSRLDSHANQVTAEARRLGGGDEEDNNKDWIRAVRSSSPLYSDFALDAVKDLPASVDWRERGVATSIKSQGMCGSCWAFASTAVLESHVAIATDTLFELSVQELVSCAENPHHCGGSGGCTGSTSELAFGHVQKHGIVDEWSFGYQSFHGEEVKCTLEGDHKGNGVDNERVQKASPVASIDGWVMLPRNNYQVVMNVLAKVGPLAVSVACSPWVAYKSGVYKGNLQTQKETDVNHLVVLEGYGNDKETGDDYWIVRNSWGPRWGESGRIRLYRNDPAKDGMAEDEFCGMDTTTADGAACTIDDKGHPIDPPPAKICGNSGILYDVSFPVGAHLT